VKKFIGDAAGNVKELVTVEIKWEKNEKGRRAKEVAGTEQTAPRAARAARDGVFLGPEQAILKDLKLETDPRRISKPSTKSIARPSEHLRAGDCRRARASWCGRNQRSRGAARNVTAS